MEFGAALPILLRRLKVSSKDQHLCLFERHVVLLGYFQAKRVEAARLPSVSSESKVLTEEIVQMYGPTMRKPKLHFSTHVDLTFERYCL